MTQSAQSTAAHSSGLRNVSIGDTALCTVGVSGSGLTYCGYEIDDLAKHCSFEETAYLLLNGELPTQQQLDEFSHEIQQLSELPAAVIRVLEALPASAHPMDVMRCACAALGCAETEQNHHEQYNHALRMLACFPSMLLYWYHYSHNGKRIVLESDNPSIAARFLEMLSGHPPSDLHQRCLDVSLILYAEHEFNASTFTARVIASTLSDLHSCIAGAIGALRGPLHGGANEQACAMLRQWRTPDEAEQGILKILAQKEKVMGFGHAVYQTCDPRNALIKHWAERLSNDAGDTRMFDVSQRVEEVMWREKKLFANADFYHASAYTAMDIPVKLFTPIFVCSRVTGWCAHVFEQRANNRIIRPSAHYVGPAQRMVKPIAQRHAS